MNNHNFNHHTEHTSYDVVYDNNTSTSNKAKPSSLMILGIAWVLIGIFFTVIPFSERKSYNDIVDDGNSTTAYVTNVERKTKTTSNTHGTKTGTRRTSRNKSTYYYVKATYTVDNEEYHMSFTSNSSFSEGQTINIFYADGNPFKYVREGDDGGSPIFGIILTIVGAVVCVVNFKKYRDERDLKAMGLL